MAAIRAPADLTETTLANRLSPRPPSPWRAFVRLCAAVGLTASLSACATPDVVLNAISASGAVDVTHDLSYGPQARQKLDVYAPRTRAPGRPVVVFFYGGSWDSGAKGMYAFVGQALAQQGYVAVVADYRLYPAARWPTFLQDCALATRWARDHAGDYGGDVSRLALMGHSAGAYNAVDLALDGRWLRAVGLDPDRDVKATVGLAGPYDFLPLDTRELKTIFGPEDQRPDTQPINHVDGHAAPLLLIAGDKDTVVDPGNTARLAAKVRAAGGKVEVITYPGIGHVRTVAALAPPLQWLTPVMRDVRAFIDRQTGYGR
jgi:acetyl esterase/lipase